MRSSSYNNDLRAVKGDKSSRNVMCSSPIDNSAINTLLLSEDKYLNIFKRSFLVKANSLYTPFTSSSLYKSETLSMDISLVLPYLDKEYATVSGAKSLYGKRINESPF